MRLNLVIYCFNGRREYGVYVTIYFHHFCHLLIILHLWSSEWAFLSQNLMMKVNGHLLQLFCMKMEAMCRHLIGHRMVGHQYIDGYGEQKVNDGEQGWQR